MFLTCKNKNFARVEVLVPAVDMINGNEDSLPLEVQHDCVTCFGQWDVNRRHVFPPHPAPQDEAFPGQCAWTTIMFVMDHAVYHHCHCHKRWTSWCSRPVLLQRCWWWRRWSRELHWPVCWRIVGLGETGEAKTPSGRECPGHWVSWEHWGGAEVYGGGAGRRQLESRI